MNGWLDIVILIVVALLVIGLIIHLVLQSRRGGQCASCAVKTRHNRFWNSGLLRRYRKRYRHGRH